MEIIQYKLFPLEKLSYNERIVFFHAYKPLFEHTTLIIHEVLCIGK